MQATSSQVTETTVSVPPFFPSESEPVEPAALILPVLQKDAKASGRDHLLVRRRRRDRRQQSR